jgi:zinc D-Ala-D-Ala carboxypeptidase
MQNTATKREASIRVAVILILLVSLAVNGYFVFQNQIQAKKIDSLLEEKDKFLSENASTIKTLEQERSLASTTINELTEKLTITTEEMEGLAEDLQREKNRNEEFEEQIEKISGTVGILDKLSKTDRELLQKYSRTYFLNENFIPLKLSQIDEKYLMPDSKDQYFHGNAVKFLEDMLDAAKEDGHDIRIISAYRSFDEQIAVKGQHTQVYGSGANAFSADQGYSEHQLGTTVDIVDLETRTTSQNFVYTEAYKWLLDNAHKYGFILSYPEDNVFYIFEPWHWRFVGRDLADDLHDDKVTFYDWDQRTIDEYLVKIFD